MIALWVPLLFGASRIARSIPTRSATTPLAAQATQAVWRGAGTGLALVGGGLLLTLGQAAPFLTLVADARCRTRC